MLQPLQRRLLLRVLVAVVLCGALLWQFEPGVVLLLRWYGASLRCCAPSPAERRGGAAARPTPRRIALLSFHTEHTRYGRERGASAQSRPSGFAALSAKRLREYGRRHGYDVWIENESLPSPNSKAQRLPSWNKVLIAMRYLPRYDWIMWIDSDALIMNQAFSLGELLQAVRSDQHLLLTRDHRGINAGVWLLRNSAWSHRFLQTWYHNATIWARTEGLVGSQYSGDQHMLQQMFGERSLPKPLQPRYSLSAQTIDQNHRHTLFLPQCAFNSYLKSVLLRWFGMYMDGDFIVHLAGHSHELKECFSGTALQVAHTQAVWNRGRFEPMDWSCHEEYTHTLFEF